MEFNLNKYDYLFIEKILFNKSLQQLCILFHTLDKDNIARPTIKQSTLIRNHVGISTGEINLPKSQQAERNMCIDERRAGNFQEQKVRNHYSNFDSEFEHLESAFL